MEFWSCTTPHRGLQNVGYRVDGANSSGCSLRRQSNIFLSSHYAYGLEQAARVGLIVV
jgi:hypothetical protein